mmetsp:Transcript_63157/g.137304  ORF Transcript_63157/g.137304 Transcript_63157/m.137304 type:complete len:196 (-) Transcript_63157:174-761(-)
MVAHWMMWLKLLRSSAFRASALKSYAVNLAFSLGINGTLYRKKSRILWLDGLKQDMVSTFFFSAFFCGLLTVLLSSCFIAREVQQGDAEAPAVEEVSRSLLRCFLRRGVCSRSLILAFINPLLFGSVTLALGQLICHAVERPCEVKVWVFLVILALWNAPVQLFTSALNFAAAAHQARRDLPLVEAACDRRAQEG